MAGVVIAEPPDTMLVTDAGTYAPTHEETR
jgi:hypothetical protein